ncbi:HAD family acid phosphatase [Halobacteriovorax sp. JY17]|uniref:phosphatase domain-containing protein n=1 Tax=Halobacteriovorax sp. JY17 TaxID=2014617 RepID=UPI000C4944A0|nr:HAD family acid phosphatase [Halobacteriovorax sp. JY17]PIK15172.1 MAG: hypothetical protein CES88_00235 [Halobacteriovorax sp. JY17]
MNSAKKRAIIVDLDGTLANCDHRVHHVEKTPKDWVAFNRDMGLDEINSWCAELVAAMEEKGFKILLLTGRGEESRNQTEEWLEKYQVPYTELYMRKAQDSREDSEIKREIFLDFIRPEYETLFVVEDRLSVVEMWRKLNITCLQCDWGNF